MKPNQTRRQVPAATSAAQKRNDELAAELPRTINATAEKMAARCACGEQMFDGICADEDCPVQRREVLMKTDRVRWTVLSPDGVPIAPETYPSEDAARKALAAWCGRYEAQGYYASVSGRIALADLPGRCRIVSDETPDMKFARIADEIKTDSDWRALLAGTYDDELAALEEIAKHYGGEVWNTGGGVYVAVVPLGPHDALAVTGEVICHYHNAKGTSMSEVFDEPDNDTSEGCVSLCD